MGRIRLLGLDLDGTLLNSKKTIDAVTMAALERAHAQGVTIVPITGRPLHGIPPLVRSLPFVRYIISCNGASIYDGQAAHSLRDRRIPRETAVPLAALLDECHLPYEVLYEGVGYSEAWVYERLIANSPQNSFLPRYIQETRRLVPSLPAFVESCDGLEELFIMAGRQEKLDRFLEQLRDVSGLHVVHPAIGALEITAEGVNKGEAMLHLASHLGILREETMAMGDSGNDLAMLRAAGLSVAMGNATEDVKTLSDFVTETNDAQGVALAVERFVLL